MQRWACFSGPRANNASLRRNLNKATRPRVTDSRQTRLSTDAPGTAHPWWGHGLMDAVPVVPNAEVYILMRNLRKHESMDQKCFTPAITWVYCAKPIAEMQRAG